MHSKSMTAAFVLLAALPLAGCGAAPATSVSASAATFPGVTPTIPGATAKPSEDASATPTTAPPNAKPTVPSTEGAIDVGGQNAAFASPSGRIWCAVDGTAAWCHFPAGMKGKIPSGEQICPGAGLDVTGVNVTKDKPAYFCSGDPTAYPVEGTDQVTWHAATGFPTVTFDSLTLAVLPYGQKVINGAYVCASESNGVTCANITTKKGFRISLSGPVFF